MTLSMATVQRSSGKPLGCGIRVDVLCTLKTHPNIVLER